MEFLNKEQLIELIRQNQINFIGSAVTPWHAHGIDCAIHYLQNKGITINGVIWVKPAIKQQEICYILSEENFINKCCEFHKSPAIYDTRLKTVLKNIYNEYKSTKWYNNQYKKRKERIIYIASPWHVDLSLFAYLYQSLGYLYGFRLILIEEGLSSYFPKIDTRKHIWNTLSINKRGISLIKSYLSSIIQRAVRKRFEANTSWINLNLLTGKAENLRPNTTSLEYYRQVLTEYAQINKGNLENLNLNNSVLICTMAYLHTEIQDNDDVRTLKQVVKALKQKGLNVYVKPHPRDKDYKNRYATLECDYIDYPCTAESLMVAFPHLRGFISFSSTSLVTANLLFGINSISILNLVEKKKYGKYIREEMEAFTYCFSNIVAMPKNIKELVDSFS